MHLKRKPVFSKPKHSFRKWLKRGVVSAVIAASVATVVKLKQRAARMELEQKQRVALIKKQGAGKSAELLKVEKIFGEKTVSYLTVEREIHIF